MGRSRSGGSLTGPDPGARSLFRRDAVLNLPPCRYSWPLRRLAVMYGWSGSYEQARPWVQAATGVGVGKRQLQQVAAAAPDAQGFYRTGPACGPARRAGTGEPGRQGRACLPLAISADGKGVAMRPGGPPGRDRPKASGSGSRPSRTGPGTGEKNGHKRMAETGVRLRRHPARTEPRTPEQVMGRAPGQPAPRAREPSTAGTPPISPPAAPRPSPRCSTRPERRDPGHARTWIALVDGDNHQIGVITGRGRRPGRQRHHPDRLHPRASEYLWKAAWCFHPPRDPAAEDWVTAQGLDILHGRAAQVITRIQAAAAADPPRPGSEHAKIIRTTVGYLPPSSPTWTTPPPSRTAGPSPPASSKAPAATSSPTGWASPAPAGACKEPRPCSGSAPSTPAATRPPTGTGTSTQEHQRNHLSRYQPARALAADTSHSRRAAPCVTNAGRSPPCRQVSSLMRCCTRDEGLLALRSRPAGGGFKPPHAALAEDRRGER